MFAGLYTVYTYLGVAFGGATRGRVATVAVLLFVWGVSATAGNLAAGFAIDRFGTRRILRAAIAVAAVNFALLPWTGVGLASALVVVAVWGFCGWAAVVPNLDRLVAPRPEDATLLTALNSAVLYLGAAASGGVGAAALAAFGIRGIGPAGAVLVAIGLILAELPAKEKSMPAYAKNATFTDPGNQPVLDFVGSLERLLVSGPQTGGEFALAEATGPRGHNAPRHRHLHATETLVVVDGEMLVEVGDDRRTAGPGAVAVMPRLVPHTFVVVSATARYLVLHTPAGFDDFIHEVDAATRTGQTLDPPALTEIAGRHGIEILGPGVSPPG